MSHTCHAFECERRVPPKMFMCKAHWFMLPKAMRDRIWRHYQPGQERGAGITEGYASAAKDAIHIIAGFEGKAIPSDAPELLVYDMTIRSEQ